MFPRGEHESSRLSHLNHSLAAADLEVSRLHPVDHVQMASGVEDTRQEGLTLHISDFVSEHLCTKALCT